MQRYFIETSFNDKGQVDIQGENRKHIAQVMRMVEGEHIIVVSNGVAMTAEIVAMTTDAVTVKKVGEPLESNEMPIQAAIVCGLAKGDKHELIVQKATELGVKEIMLFKAERSIVKWDDKKGKRKLERLEKIAKLAAEQSHRQMIPTIVSPQTVKQLVERSVVYDHCFFAYEQLAKKNERPKLMNHLKTIKEHDRVLIVFGPEGGLSEDEAHTLSVAGFTPIALGPRILRTETAPLYLLSALSYQFE